MKGFRQGNILQMLRNDPLLSTSELAEHFHVTTQTIRRDLAALEAQGLLIKKYGGAVIPTLEQPTISPFAQRMVSAHDEKVRIAKAALPYIEDGSTIALDAGTTILEVVKLLDTKKNLTILTNDIYLAAELHNHTPHRVYMVGGFIGNEGATSGNFVNELLASIASVDTLLMSADGFTPEEGLTSDMIGVVDFKIHIMKKTVKKIALLDHSKFGHNYFYKICGIRDLDCLITDAGTPADCIAKIRAAGVAVDSAG